MIIIPELQKVLILVPRTGSGTIKRAIAKQYPKSMLIYRHMEADGIPQGYDRWEKIGIVREPVERLWSLYKFLRTFDGKHETAYIDSMRTSVDRPFSDWVLHNEVVFTSPYDSSGRGRYYPEYSVRHPIPENRKSQFMYLRPDLGTRIFTFDQMDDFAALLGVDLSDRQNQTDAEACPPLSRSALDYIDRVFQWDLRASFSGDFAPLKRSA